MCQATDAQMLQRFHDFEIDLDYAIAERIEDLGAGLTALLSPSIPLVWNANYLVVEEAGASAAEIAARADELFADLGLKHRYVVTRSPGLADELEPDFHGLGWEIDRSLFMVRRREADRPGLVAVEPVDLETAWTIRVALTADHPWMTPEVDPQLLEFDRRMAKVYRDRWFAAREEGTIASGCRLYQHDGIGQVEDVATLPEARNRGLARAVVLAAASASRADGDELTFITADAGDWPLQLYERLGFDPIGVVQGFRIRPT